MDDERRARADRLAHLREQLDAYESYGNGDAPAAEALRAEIADLEAQNRRPKKGSH